MSRESGRKRAVRMDGLRIARFAFRRGDALVKKSHIDMKKTLAGNIGPGITIAWSR
jgi:hypothetical protein